MQWFNCHHLNYFESCKLNRVNPRTYFKKLVEDGVSNRLRA